MQISVKIEGLEKVQEKLSALGPRILMGLSTAIKKSVFILEGESKKNTPVDTGRLRASILTSIYPLSATISPTVNYAVFVHEGTRFLKSRPFMTDAVEQTKDEISDIFNSEIQKIL